MPKTEFKTIEFTSNLMKTTVVFKDDSKLGNLEKSLVTKSGY